MTDITDDNVEKVLKEGLCRCGQPYLILKLKNEDTLHHMHKKPPCAHYLRLPTPLWLKWVETGEAELPPEQPAPNRRQRRAATRARRRGQS